MTLYHFYRLGLLILTIIGTVNFALQIRQYKQSYDRFPQPLKNYIAEKGKEIFLKQLQNQRKDLAINGSLLGVLIVLNIWLLLG